MKTNHHPSVYINDVNEQNLFQEIQKGLEFIQSNEIINKNSTILIKPNLKFNEEWMTNMITNPSKRLPDINFSVGGGGFGIDMGNAALVGHISYSAFREFCCGSKINLNITRWSHTNVYASATARPFDLAAYGACIVSQPYNGIDSGSMWARNWLW